MTPTWQVAVFVLFRVATALPTLRWPLAGALVALAGDLADLFLMNAIGGIDDYQRLDKLCDLSYLATFLAVALRWRGLERNVAVATLAYRMIGEVVFEITDARWVLLVFPNVFEFWFIAVAALRHYRPGAVLTRREAAVAFAAVLVGKEAQEYFLHLDRFLDQFSAFQVAEGLWIWITRR